MCYIHLVLIGLVCSVLRLSIFVKAIVHILRRFVHIVQLLKSDCVLQHAATDIVNVSHVSGLLVQSSVIFGCEKLNFAMNNKAAAGNHLPAAFLQQPS